ncbi:Low-affinity iron/zinc ion transport protein [Lachnellula willkommii]|uniref:Low-affinity iron/zinc ion transport protein n=1 Tax=Lachnellula willkommii TaxID=215461 RepID=A0A559MDT2_9HELO|nr:Low-affinity iron/zinc ion transport protein [Lachnellula willkommii]
MVSWWKSFVVSLTPSRDPIYAAAPTQNVQGSPSSSFKSSASSIVDEKRDQDYPRSLPSDLTSKHKANVFDKITRAAGTPTFFFIMLSLVTLWALAGIVYGPSDTWQIIFQNASSVQVYIESMLLLRQQATASRAIKTTLAEVQSRNKSCERLLRQIPDCAFMETHSAPQKDLSVEGKSIDDETARNLSMVAATPTRFQRIWSKSCRGMSVVLGSIYAFTIYWIGIGVWIALGPSLMFGDEWQLYINTATAVALTFTSVFLQSLEQQQEDTLETCLEFALKIDADIEYHLRDLLEDNKPNPIVSIPVPSSNRVEGSIERFGLAFGGALGGMISLIFLVGWIAVGPLLQFNDNWILILGTFTGLIGFVMSFTLRNLFTRAEKEAEYEFRAIADSDEQLLNMLNVPVPKNPKFELSLSARIGVATGEICANQWTWVAAVFTVFALLLTATLMQWSETGQLLCNTPTMIIEGFLLLVLIQASNASVQARSADFNGVLKRRLLLNSYVHTLSYENQI